MRQIAENFEIGSFPEFEGILLEYKKSHGKKTFEEVEGLFYNDYDAFSKKMQVSGKMIVLFFDTYEVIQNKEYSIRSWLENDLFTRLNGSTRLFVVGRNPLSCVHSEKMYVKEMELGRFDISETKEYLEKNLKENELAQLIGT